MSRFSKIPRSSKIFDTSESNLSSFQALISISLSLNLLHASDLCVRNIVCACVRFIKRRPRARAFTIFLWLCLPHPLHPYTFEYFSIFFLSIFAYARVCVFELYPNLDTYNKTNLCSPERTFLYAEMQHKVQAATKIDIHWRIFHQKLH